MADDKKGNAAKDFLLKHGEKLALGAALLVLAAYVLLLKPEPDPNLRKADEAIRNVKQQSGTTKDQDLPPAAKPWEQAATTPWNTTIMAKAGGDNWAATLYSELEEKVRPKPKVVLKPVLAPSVDFGTVEVDLSHVKITWEVKEFTKVEKAKDKVNEYTDLTGFKVERQKTGGAWETLADGLAPTERAFTDTKIDPKTAYNYRVTAYADTKEYKERGGPSATPRPDGMVAMVTAPAPAQTLGIWKMSFLNPFKPENAEKGQVYVKIEKYEKALGSKVEKARIHHAGDVIGWWPEGAGEPTSKHRVQVGTKAAMIDFDTKTTLVSVEPRKVIIEIKKCTPKFTGGLRDGCNTVTEKRSFDVHEIVLKGPDGDERILSPNPREHVNGQDQFCEDHGGRRPGAAPAPGGAKTTEPAEDPAAAAARKREAEAEKLFKDAEKLVASNKGPQAAVIFEKLLKEYGTTDFVSKNAQAVIEERLRTLRQ